MKLTVTQWTNVQGRIYKEHPFLDAHIENRTYGKRWSQEVAIGLHAHDEKIVRDALAAIEAPATKPDNDETEKGQP